MEKRKERRGEFVREREGEFGRGQGCEGRHSRGFSCECSIRSGHVLRTRQIERRGFADFSVPKLFGPPQANHPTSQLPQHGFARTSRWEYLGKSSSESTSLPGTGGDSSVKLDFGLSDGIIDEKARKAWPYSFGLTYSVTLSTGELETSLEVRNTGSEAWEFCVLLHSYWRVEVSLAPLFSPNYWVYV